MPSTYQWPIKLNGLRAPNQFTHLLARRWRDRIWMRQSGQAIVPRR